MHHRIMVRRERESENKIARFGGLKPPIPAISNASASEKQTLAQSLRGLFTDDYLVKVETAVYQPADAEDRQSGDYHNSKEQERSRLSRLASASENSV